MTNKLILIFVLIFVFLYVGCLKTEIEQRTEKEMFFRAEELKIDSALAAPEAEDLHRLIKENRLDEVYDHSSFCLKATYTRERFVSEINVAIDKLKSIDPNLDVWENKHLDSPPPYKFDLVKGYGVGDSPINPKYVYRKDTKRKAAYILTYWQKEAGKMKLCGYQVLSNKFYGTSACVVTLESSAKDENFEYIDKTIIVNTHDSYITKQKIPLEKPTIVSWLDKLWHYN